MRLLLVLALGLCTAHLEPGSAEWEKQARKERGELFVQFVKHFDRGRASQDEYNFRYGIFSANLKRLLSPALLPSEQLFFAKLEKGEAVVIHNPERTDRCGPHFALTGIADMTAEELAAELVRPVVFSPEQLREGFALLRELYPDAQPLIDLLAQGREEQTLKEEDAVLPGSGRKLSELYEEVLPTYAGGMTPDSDKESCMLRRRESLVVPSTVRRRSSSTWSSEGSAPGGARLLPRGRLLPAYFRAYSPKHVRINGKKLHKYVNYSHFLNSVKHQDGCLVCFVISASDMVSMQYGIKYREVIELSIQQFIDCLPGDLCRTGGDVSWIFNYINREGISDAAHYAYKAQKGYCAPRGRRYSLRVVPLPFEPKVFTTLHYLQRGPVVIPMNSSYGMQNINPHRVFEGYDCNPFAQTDMHALLFYGYRLNRKYGSYFYVKNSWRHGWGINNHFRLRLQSVSRHAYIRCALQNFKAFHVNVYDTARRKAKKAKRPKRQKGAKKVKKAAKSERSGKSTRQHG